MRTHRPTAEFPHHLEALYARFPFERSLADDPISEVRPLAKDLRRAEVAGVFATTLAIGNTTAIRGAIVRLVGLSGGDIAWFVAPGHAKERSRRLRAFRHRWIRGDQLDYLSRVLEAYYRTHDSLEEAFAAGLAIGGFAEGLDALARTLRGETVRARLGPAPRGYEALFPSPRDRPGSPCKRLTLFVRWMVRDRYPDLGMWTRVPSGELRIPLDQHVHWIAFHLGLTARRTRSWAAVEEVSEALRRIDPLDPIRYDFVLCHTGISGDCPKERDISICGPCSVRPDCRLWRGVRPNG
ncbi:MAG TPA: DUF2400 family protein [Thermoplasmata archaeon]|nr:DUF2400 family protein [Thermoplasmata archaeon]